MKPQSAGSGPAALSELRRAAAAAAPYRLAILDLMMPEMDGFELAGRVRSDPDLDGCALIMLSSAARTGDADRCRQIGIARYMTKPFVQSDLLDAILEVVGASALDPTRADSTTADTG